MNYYIYDIRCATELTEILLAFLSEQPFDTFQENEKGLQAFLPASENETAVETYLKELQQQFDFQYERHFSPAQNWNEVWESNFQPVQVGNFCGIRAEFHEAMPDVQHELIIQPKMSFGTGHHATTFQMVEMMQHLDFQGKSVFDYGCGTGVLAILAAKLGATKIDAIDIEEWAVENSKENAKRNNVAHINVQQSDLTNFHQGKYQIILANITFNVISTSLEALYQQSSDDALLATSGFFVDDIPKLLKVAQQHNWHAIRQSQKDNWACVQFGK